MNIINEKIVHLLNGYHKPLTSFLEDLRQTQEEEGIPIILKDSEMLLHSILTMNKPERLLEIGTAGGYSASFFASALAKLQVDYQIVTVEKEEKLFRKAKGVFQQQDLQYRITSLLGDGRDIVELLEKEEFFKPPKAFDMIFLDGGKSHYQRFWEEAMVLSKKGTIIICDNVLLKASVADPSYDKSGRHITNIKRMQDFLAEITRLDHVDTWVLPVGDGMSVSYVK